MKNVWSCLKNIALCFVMLHRKVKNVSNIFKTHENIKAFVK